MMNDKREVPVSNMHIGVVGGPSLISRLCREALAEQFDEGLHSDTIDTVTHAGTVANTLRNISGKLYDCGTANPIACPNWDEFPNALLGSTLHSGQCSFNYCMDAVDTNGVKNKVTLLRAPSLYGYDLMSKNASKETRHKDRVANFGKMYAKSK